MAEVKDYGHWMRATHKGTDGYFYTFEAWPERTTEEGLYDVAGPWRIHFERYLPYVLGYQSGYAQCNLSRYQAERYLRNPNEAEEFQRYPIE